MINRARWTVALVALALAACDGGGGGGALGGDVADAGAGTDGGGDVVEVPDQGPVDTGAADDAGDTAATPDAATPDAGVSDVAEDVGAGQDVLPDAGPEDTGSLDALLEDTAAEDVPSEDTPPGDAGPEDAGVEDAGPGDVSEDTGPVEPPYDCAGIPKGPFQLVKLQGPVASEDIAFDKEGRVVGSNDKAIFKSYYGGTPQVFVPKLNFRAGMRYLPNGHLVVCDNQKGQLVRVDEKGEIHTLVTGLSYPNGIVVDMQGWVLFTEHDANKVWRVHPFTGAKQLLTTKIVNPNGLTFSPDYKTLYIGGFSGVGTIYAMSISPDGVPGKLIEWATKVGTGWLDGMGVDICGNVYIADYNATIIYRISPDGKTKTPIIHGSSIGAYLPNMDWGSGLGGWKETNLYLPNGWAKEVFEVELGVPPKARPYP
ncbi:MAG: hypothetical protein AMXMBFR64_23440 [Myxococcales bacterium]